MLKLLLVALVICVGGLWIASIIITRNVEQEFPRIGEMRSINGAGLHYVDVPATPDVDAPAIVFIHGAGGNLRDAMAVYRSRLEGEARLVFLDRPGHGYSHPYEGSNDPKVQASSIAALLDDLGIEKGIIVGHSFGGVVAAAFGVLYPEKTSGLVFLAPVSHPWGTGVDWTYDVGNTPVVGRVFSQLIVPVGGLLVYRKSIKRVFAPNPLPEDYARMSGTKLAIRPHSFFENAKDVARVDRHVEEFHPRYKEISVPTVIFHGDQDDIVSLEIHSINGLSKDIKEAQLFVLEGVGHKPDYVAVEQIVEEIRKIASTPD